MHINGIMLKINLREICSLFGYEEMRTPVFEHTELFKRSVGDTTDIVRKKCTHLQIKVEEI